MTLPRVDAARLAVRLRFAQPEQILTVRVALGRIDLAAGWHRGLDGAVCAGRYGDPAQSGKLALEF